MKILPAGGVVAVLLTSVLAIAACGPGAASAPGGTASSANGASPMATDAPPVAEPPVAEPPVAQPPVAEPPPAGRGELTAQPGQLDVHEIPADLLEAEVDGRSVTIRITFTSGVEPCYVLDTIVVTRGDRSFALTLRQGHGPGDVACIDIAKTKYALVNLGELEPGTYAITDAVGGAAPIEVVVT